MVKVYLSQKDIPFTEKNVSIDEEARTSLLKMGRSTTPVTVIGEELVVGYQPDGLQKALDKLLA